MVSCAYCTHGERCIVHLCFHSATTKLGKKGGTMGLLLRPPRGLFPPCLSVCLSISEREITTPQQIQVIFGGKDVECGTFAFL